MPDDVVTTCVNYGYARSGLLENWLASVASVGLHTHVLPITLDDKAQALLNSRGIPAFRWNWERFPYPSEGSIEFSKDGWKAITFSKMQVVHEMLALGKNVLFSDTDIVFLQNPLPLLKALKPPVSVQSDTPAESRGDSDWRSGSICSGFYYARSGPETRQLFDCDRPDTEPFPRDDQELLHQRLIATGEAPAFILPRQLFPNGDYWEEKRPVDPYIIHYNWCTGTETKIARMVEDRHWHETAAAGDESASADGTPAPASEAEHTNPLPDQ